MGNLVRLRISLADRPGALAKVAAIIADHGGNITSVDVQRVDDESAVDDLVVDFADEPDLDNLRSDLVTNGAAVVMSHQQNQTVDPFVASLRRLVQMVDTGWLDLGAALVEGVAELCASPAVWVSDIDEARHYEAGRFALDHHAAVVLRTTELPAHLAERLAGEIFVLAVFDPEWGSQGRVVFVGRPETNPFTATEIARVESLAALHGRIERLVAGSEGRAGGDFVPL
jgi:23S rRNA U2552 (ribose-2'-O)-methylase RlmE/FtsJ